MIERRREGWPSVHTESKGSLTQYPLTNAVPSLHHHQYEKGSQPRLVKVTEITKKHEQRCSALEQQTTGDPPEIHYSGVQNIQTSAKGVRWCHLFAPLPPRDRECIR